MSTELEGFLKETLVAYSSYSFFVCAEELRNIAFHHCQQTREKKKMKQVNESQQLKRNGTERCRKYNENNQRNVQAEMELMIITATAHLIQSKDTGR